MAGAEPGMSSPICVRGLELRRGDRDILRGVAFDLHPGEVVALMGLSGCGKTTVLRAIAGLENVSRGSTHVITGARPRVGFVFQFHCLFEHLTVIENVCLAPVHAHRVTRRDAHANARQLLDELGIGHRADALPRELSGGEAQRAAIARALAVDPPVLLLDEPTASLDPPRRAALGTVLSQLASTGRAILLTSHDVDFVRDHATRVLILADGLIAEQGVPNEVFEAPSHEVTRSLVSLRPSASP
jgi:ABC-type polar amino acid transport system ATPase subunit